MIDRVRIVIPFAWASIGTKNLGTAYNVAMAEAEQADPEAWVCFLDYDAMFLSVKAHALLVKYANVAESLNYGLLGAMTNRIGNRGQIPKSGIDPGNHDIRAHRAFASELERNNPTIKEITRSTTKLSGVVMLTSVKAWRKSGGFSEGFYVDNDYHRAIRDAGMRVGVMQTLYVYHWYRGDGDLSHLPRDASGRILLNRYGINPGEKDCGCGGRNLGLDETDG